MWLWQIIVGFVLAVTFFISFLSRKLQGWSPLFQSKGLPYGRKVEGHGGEGQQDDQPNDDIGGWYLTSKGC